MSSVVAVGVAMMLSM